MRAFDFLDFEFAPLCHWNPTIVLRRIFLNDKRRGLNDGAIIGNIARDSATCSDSDVVADFDVADNSCARANVNVVANRRSTGTFAVEERIAADCDVLKNCAALADFRERRYKNSVEGVRRREWLDSRFQRYTCAEIAIDNRTLEPSFLPFQIRFRGKIFFERRPENFLQRTVVETVADGFNGFHVPQRVDVVKNISVYAHWIFQVKVSLNSGDDPQIIFRGNGIDALNLRGRELVCNVEFRR